MPENGLAHLSSYKSQELVLAPLKPRAPLTA